jgi:hypothetical protein
MNNDQAQSRNCYCVPAADVGGNPLLKTLNISAGTRGFSFVFTHLATFVIAYNTERTRLTMAFPTHRVTLEADNDMRGEFKDVATGFYYLVYDQTGSPDGSPPKAQACNTNDGRKVLKVTKITVAKRPEYEF